MASTLEQTQAAPATLRVEDGVAIIQLDQPGKPVNVLSNEMIEALTEIIERLERGEGDVRAALIVSGKPGVWIAGADIEEFTRFHSPSDGEAASRAGHALLARLEQLRIPVIAVIDGVALGGGLEVALACAYRIATDSPKTKLGLPEVQLGIIPGAGGTQRLPRLVGLRAALELILSGKQLDALRAKSIGLVDEVIPASAVLPIAIRIAREVADGRRNPRAGRERGSPEWAENLPGVRGFILKKAREGVMEKTHGLYPAPLRALDVVEHGLDRPLAEGLAMEARVFGELSVTPEARSLVHVFFISTEAKSAGSLGELAAKPRPVEQIAIIGAGFMGAGIATVSAESGLRVRLKDVTPEAAARGLRTTYESLASRAKRRKKRPFEIAALKDRVEATTEYTGLRHTDVVVEAVFEDVSLKHRVIREIEAAAGPETVLGTNTSTIPIATIAEAATHPERVIGLHFFSPVEKMPLLEIIVTDRTAPEVVATSHAFGKKIGKTPIVVHDGPGFYVNRILAPYMNEAALLLEEGVPIEDIDGAMTDWGFPVGPITLFDEVGLDVALKSGTIMAEAFHDRISPNRVIESLVADGRMGRKNGRGFFTYENGKNRKNTEPKAKKGAADESVYALIGSPTRITLAEGEIQERLSLGMINEAVRCLEDGILRTPRDGDVGAVFGIGFPPFRGGPFWYIDQTGASEVLQRLRTLEARFGPRFAPAPRLVQMAEQGERFF